MIQAKIDLSRPIVSSKVKALCCLIKPELVRYTTKHRQMLYIQSKFSSKELRVAVMSRNHVYILHHYQVPEVYELADSSVLAHDSMYCDGGGLTLVFSVPATSALCQKGVSANVSFDISREFV